MQTYSRAARVILVVVLAAVAVPAAVSIRHVVSFDESKQPWACSECSLANGMILQLCQRAAHPFLAEYRRHLAVSVAGSELIRCPLPPDVGSGTHIEVYWRAAPAENAALVLLREGSAEFLLSLPEGVLRRVVRNEGGVFAGVVTSDDVWTSITQDVTGRMTVKVCGVVAEDVTGSKIDESLTYRGRFDTSRGAIVFAPAK